MAGRVRRPDAQNSPRQRTALPVRAVPMPFRLFGPSQDEVDALARDLIARHGLGAYDEAVRLSEIVQLLPRALRQRRLYELAAARIGQSAGQSFNPRPA